MTSRQHASLRTDTLAALQPRPAELSEGQAVSEPSCHLANSHPRYGGALQQKRGSGTADKRRSQDPIISTEDTPLVTPYHV